MMMLGFHFGEAVRVTFLVKVFELSRDRRQILFEELPVAIPEVDNELAIFFTQAAHHEHKLKACGEGIARNSKLLKQTKKIGLVRFGGQLALGMSLGKI